MRDRSESRGREIRMDADARCAAWVAAAVAAILTGRVAHAAPPRPDTSAWTCSRCVFYHGEKTKVQVGVLVAEGANAGSGRYSGIDHNGAYLEADGSGRWRTAGGTYGSYSLERLGLDSRRLRVTAGEEGMFQLRLTYQGQPFRQYDGTLTPYRLAAPDRLVLPADWVSANSTAGMSAAGSSLAPVHIGTIRRTVALSGQVFLGAQWTLFAKFSHAQRTGMAATGASFLTEALQLPEPVDDRTDNVHAGALWSARRLSVRLVYDGSWYHDGIDALAFQNPYLPIVPGATTGLLSGAPNNDLQQLAVSGQVILPVWSGVLTYLASAGRLAQDGSFVSGSALASLPLSLPGSLPGDLDLTHDALTVALQPSERLELSGRATYDGHDDHTAVLLIPYVVTDTLPGGTYLTPRFGRDRTRLAGRADYHLWRWLRVGIGGTYVHTHFSPGQVLSSSSEQRGWGQVTLVPLTAVTVSLKGGSARRDASAFNAAALPVGENPLLLAYDYAPRDSEFLQLRATWAIAATLAWAIDGSAATEAYRRSQFGLSDGRQRELSTTLTWAPLKALSVYLDGSYEHLQASQYALQLPATIPWQAREGEYFWSAGAGGTWAVSRRWRMKADYVHAGSRSDTGLNSSGGPQTFPQASSTLDTAKAALDYRWSAALTLRAQYRRDQFGSSDWALEGVDPTTIPLLLALGEQPYRYTLDSVAVSFIYRL